MKLIADFTCQKEEFKCKSRQDCVPTRWVCDGNKDCSDGSDEFNCGKEEEYDEDDCVANEDTIKCLSSGKCISR